MRGTCLGAVIGAVSLAIPVAFYAYRDAAGGAGCWDMDHDGCGKFSIAVSLVFTIPVGGVLGVLIGALVGWILYRRATRFQLTNVSGPVSTQFRGGPPPPDKPAP